MGSWLRAIQVIAALVPQIIDIIRAIEIPGNGADKLALVKDIIRAIIETLPEDIAGALKGKLDWLLDRIVGAVVGFLNKVGIFKPAPSA